MVEVYPDETEKYKAGREKSKVWMPTAEDFDLGLREIIYWRGGTQEGSRGGTNHRTETDVEGGEKAPNRKTR